MRGVLLLLLGLTTMTVQAQTVIELRQYNIFAGKREQMIDVFDGKLIEGQEQVGMRVLGQFRALDDPNRFVWMREFSNMEERGRALTAFYTGPVWRAHRGEANPLLEDHDNLLLLRPAAAELGLASKPASERAKVGSQPASAGLIVATIYYLWKDPAEGFTKFFQGRLAPDSARIRPASSGTTGRSWIPRRGHAVWRSATP
jgi:hypothetical protein